MTTAMAYAVFCAQVVSEPSVRRRWIPPTASSAPKSTCLSSCANTVMDGIAAVTRVCATKPVSAFIRASALEALSASSICWAVSRILRSWFSARSLRKGSMDAPDLPKSSMARAVLPAPSSNSESFKATSFMTSAGSRRLPLASLARMPKNCSALVAPAVSSSTPARPLESLARLPPMASIAVPEMVATGAKPDSAVALAPVCSARPCSAAEVSRVWVTKSRSAATEVVPMTTAKAVRATPATCCSEAFMSEACLSSKRALRPRSA